MEYQIYSSYQSTNIAWVKKLPSHWDLMKISHLAQLASGENITSQQINPVDDYPVYGGNGLRGYFDQYTHDDHYILIGRQGALCGNINHANGRFWASEHAVVVTPDRELSTNFLDHKTQQIDQLIEKKKALIEKLEEKRIAVITQAVTKGLDKDVKLVPSGVDWLGNVPEGGEVRRLRFLLSMNLTNGLFKKSEFWGSGKPIVNVFDVYIHGDDIVNEHTLDRVECDEDEYKKYCALDGDFFFVRSSLKLEGVGKSATVVSPDEEIVFECHLVRGRPDQGEVDPLFLNFSLNSKYARNHFVSAANVVTMATIDQMKLKNLMLALPSLKEQKKIIEYLQGELTYIDGIKNKIIQTMSRLQEYRSALITAAVTGKIDVCNWQPSATQQAA